MSLDEINKFLKLLWCSVCVCVCIFYEIIVNVVGAFYSKVNLKVR